MLKLTKAKGTAVTTTEHKSKGKTIAETGTSEAVDAPASAVKGEPCRVGMDLSYTHNLGDFKSVRVGVSLSIPCKHSEIDEVFDFADKWCDAKLQKLIGDVTGGEDEAEEDEDGE